MMAGAGDPARSRANPPEPTPDELRLRLRISELSAAMKAKQQEFLAVLDRLQEREETAVKRALEELSRSEKRYRLLARVTTDIIYDWDIARDEVTWNQALRTVLGYSPADPGRTVEETIAWRREHIHPADVETVARGFQNALDGDATTWEAEYRIRRADGGYATVLDRAHILRGDGQAVRILGSMVDLTERIEYQRRLEETTERLKRAVTEVEARSAEADTARTLAESAERRARFLAQASHILSKSFEHQTTFQTIAHLAVPELADWCVVDMVEENGEVRRVAATAADPEDLELLREYDGRFPPGPADGEGAELLRTGESLLMPEVTDDLLRELAREPDHIRQFRRMGLRSLMVLPMISRGRVLGAITLAATESDRQYGPEDLKLARELAQRAALAVDNARLYGAALVASQAKSDFLAVISHELRTPLNAIMGYTDLLLLGVPERIPDAGAEQIERVRRAAQHLLQLIEEILTFSRVEAGEERLDLSDVDVADVTREVCELVEPLALEKGLRFEVDGADEPLTIRTDRGKLRQILLNLASNSVKFTDEGLVGITVEAERGIVRIRVRDTGLGIEPEYLDRIFEPFWQVQQSWVREQGGTGLGLSVSRTLARMLGGEVMVESEPGRGSTFTVVLPLEPPDGPDPGERHWPRPSGRAGRAAPEEDDVTGFDEDRDHGR